MKENIVGIDGKRNKADIQRERVSNDVWLLGAKDRINKISEEIKPDTFESAGFAIVMMYKNESNKVNPEYRFACFSSLGKVEEGFADVGLKELRRNMMEAYGREQPRERK